MDSRLKINNELRPNVLDGMAEIPLYSIAWRYLKSMYARQEKADQARREATETRRKSLGGMAQEVFTLKRQALAEAPADAPADAPALLPLYERLQAQLEALDTHIVAPDGEVYDDDLMEILDNLVPQPDPTLTMPVVRETITPTIFCEGELVQRGRAVIGVPELKLPPVDNRQGTGNE